MGMTIKICALITTAVALAAGIAKAEDTAMANAAEMERCKVVKEGKGIIKEAMADGVADIAVAGQNKAGDINAWIMVPKGQCDKVNAGDFSGIDAVTKSKLEG